MSGFRQATGGFKSFGRRADTDRMGCVHPPLCASRPFGLTLVELLVALAIVGVLIGLAAPVLRDGVSRNRAAAAANDLTATVLRARNEAATVNTCVVLCPVQGLVVDAKGNPDVNPNNAQPRCRAGADWSGGWVAFREPQCDAAAVGPDEAQGRPMVAVIGPLPTGHRMSKVGGSVDRIMFAPVGGVRAVDPGRFDLRQGDTPRDSDRSICLNRLGRTRVVPFGDAC
jgi:type IV fimbrial biogenesis protein FimT